MPSRARSSARELMSQQRHALALARAPAAGRPLSTFHRRRQLRRISLRERRVPRRDLSVARTPRKIGKAKIGVRERASDCDVADAEGVAASAEAANRSALGAVMATTVRTRVSRSARPVSWAAIMTLRTNGERGDQCSFITPSPGGTQRNWDRRSFAGRFQSCHNPALRYPRQISVKEFAFCVTRITLRLLRCG